MRLKFGPTLLEPGSPHRQPPVDIAGCDGVGIGHAAAPFCADRNGCLLQSRWPEMKAPSTETRRPRTACASTLQRSMQTARKAATPKPSLCPNAPSPSAKTRSGRSTRRSPSTSATSLCSTGRKAAMPRPSLWPDAASLSARRRSALSTRMSPSASTTSRTLYDGARPLCRGRAFAPARPRHQREGTRDWTTRMSPSASTTSR